jgi:hypothetical protein
MWPLYLNLNRSLASKCRFREASSPNVARAYASSGKLVSGDAIRRLCRISAAPLDEIDAVAGSATAYSDLSGSPFDEWPHADTTSEQRRNALHAKSVSTGDAVRCCKGRLWRPGSHRDGYSRRAEDV